MTNEEIFCKAVLSNNTKAILDAAKAFNDIGDFTKASVLLERLGLFHGIGFGVDYSAVQKKLNDLGANPKLDVDGNWGAKSKAALTLFQKSKGLTADGIPGPITLSALGISAANDVASSTMGSVTPAAASADAKAYAVAMKGGKEMGLTDKEIQYVVSVARGEGYYGSGWANPSAKTIELSKQFGLTGYEGKGSNNWGAVQGSGNAGSFPHVDVHADGSGYKANYRKYSSPEEGFKDMARIILGGGKRKEIGKAEIKTAIAEGNLTKAVFAQHANGYFELAPEKYLSAVMSNYNKIMAGVGWPKILGENGITPAIAAKGAGVGIGVILGLGGLFLFLFRKRLGLVG
jgi:peptidoglycan hydrolase-like protein with peptidoglycan-binding domain